MSEEKNIIQQFTSGEYKEGFVTDVEQEFLPKGLNEDIFKGSKSPDEKNGDRDERGLLEMPGPAD